MNEQRKMKSVINHSFNKFFGFMAILFTLLISHDVYGQHVVDSSRVVRILTFNIYHGETVNAATKFDLDLLAKVINDVNPDLVALQEVDFKTKRARNLDLVTELGKRTGLAPIFGKAMPYDGGEYGEGILSRYSFLRTQNHALDARDGKEPRAAIEVNVILRSGDTIRFVGTHFDHTRENIDRVNQAKQLNNILLKEDIPTLLAGDLNSMPDGEPMKFLFQHWTPSFPEFTPTAPSSNPRAKIDYILFRPANRWRILEARVIDDKIASDHCPVLSVLELLPNHRNN